MDALAIVIERTCFIQVETYDFLRSLGAILDGIIAENPDVCLLPIFRSPDHFRRPVPPIGRN